MKYKAITRNLNVSADANYFIIFFLKHGYDQNYLERILKTLISRIPVHRWTWNPQTSVHFSHRLLKTGRDVIINASFIQGYHQSLKNEVNLT